jgi:TatD DNase family protein
MQFFDAHTHVQFSVFDADRDEVMARAKAVGVGMINVGTQKDTSQAAIALTEKYDGAYAAIGLHPIHTGKSYHDEQELGGGDGAKAFTSRGEVFDVATYRLLAMHPKTVAIGECGLDYFRFNETEDRETQIKKQKAAFVAQMELSHEIKKPLMIHCRNAFADLIRVIKENRALLNGEPGVIHFFTGTPDDARALLDLGFSFTFGGVVTFARNYDETIKMIPIDRILSETDAPYLAPVPYRGKRNEPAYVSETVKKLAELKNIPAHEISAQILTNAKRIFAL